MPGKDALYIQQRTESRAEVSPESVLMVDFDCNVIEGKGKPPSETVIHCEILKARPEVNAVIHNHMELAIAFTMMKGVTMLPMRSRAARWASGIPQHSDPSHIKRLEQGQALAKTLGPHNAALMRTHGMVLVAESLPALTADTIHFEENARAMMEVLQAGKEPIPLCEEDMVQINRNEDRARRMCAQLQEGAMRARGAVAGSMTAGRTTEMSTGGFHAFINCTPVGMQGGPDPQGNPLASDVHLDETVAVMDTVYAPRDTPLLIHSRSRSARTVDGWVMFTKQAERQFRLWNTD